MPCLQKQPTVDDLKSAPEQDKHIMTLPRKTLPASSSFHLLSHKLFCTKQSLEGHRLCESAPLLSESLCNLRTHSLPAAHCIPCGKNRHLCCESAISYFSLMLSDLLNVVLAYDEIKLIFLLNTSLPSSGDQDVSHGRLAWSSHPDGAFLARITEKTVV